MGKKLFELASKNSELVCPGATAFHQKSHIPKFRASTSSEKDEEKDMQRISDLSDSPSFWKKEKAAIAEGRMTGAKNMEKRQDQLATAKELQYYDLGKRGAEKFNRLGIVSDQKKEEMVQQCEDAKQQAIDTYKEKYYGKNLDEKQSDKKQSVHASRKKASESIVDKILSSGDEKESFQME